jgi:hypothetical protein
MGNGNESPRTQGRTSFHSFAGLPFVGSTPPTSPAGRNSLSSLIAILEQAIAIADEDVKSVDLSNTSSSPDRISTNWIQSKIPTKEVNQLPNRRQGMVLNTYATARTRPTQNVFDFDVYWYDSLLPRHPRRLTRNQEEQLLKNKKVRLMQEHSKSLDKGCTSRKMSIFQLIFSQKWL